MHVPPPSPALSPHFQILDDLVTRLGPRPRKNEVRVHFETWYPPHEPQSAHPHDYDANDDGGDDAAAAARVDDRVFLTQSAGAEAAAAAAAASAGAATGGGRRDDQQDVRAAAGGEGEQRHVQQSLQLACSADLSWVHSKRAPPGKGRAAGGSGALGALQGKSGSGRGQGGGSGREGLLPPLPQLRASASGKGSGGAGVSSELGSLGDR